MRKKWIEMICLPTELTSINDFVPLVQLQKSVMLMMPILALLPTPFFFFFLLV